MRDAFLAGSAYETDEGNRRRKIIRGRAAHKLAKAAAKEKRIAQLFEWRREGLSLTQIAPKLGITKERVRQLVAEYLPPELQTQHAKKVQRTCPKCGTSFEVIETEGKKYCSRVCHIAAITKYTTPEEAKEGQRKRNNWRYHNDPKRRAQQIAANKQWHDKAKHNPEFQAKWRAYHAVWKKRKLEEKIARIKVSFPKMTEENIRARIKS